MGGCNVFVNLMHDSRAHSPHSGGGRPLVLTTPSPLLLLSRKTSTRSRQRKVLLRYQCYSFVKPPSLLWIMVDFHRHSFILSPSNPCRVEICVFPQLLHIPSRSGLSLDLHELRVERSPFSWCGDRHKERLGPQP